MPWNKNGFSVVELIVVLSILALVAAIGVPPILELSSNLRLYVAAQELSGALRLARSEAARRACNVAVKFRSDRSGVTYTLYRDGDGDGVLTKDIDKGVDPALSRPRPLQYLGNRMRFGFPPVRRVRDPGSSSHWMKLQDPVRFNNSDMASFGPLGTSTAGSAYLTDGKRLLMAVRVFNRTGKVKIIAYDFEEEVWR